MIVAFDFDGTITYKNCYPEIGQVNPVAIEVIKGLQKMGGKAILWTCRSGKELDEAVNICKILGVEFDAVNDNLLSQQQIFGNQFPGTDCNARKIYADLYVDDKTPESIAHGCVNWGLVDLIINRTMEEVYYGLGK